jgi:hypothetical protein
LKMKRSGEEIGQVRPVASENLCDLSDSESTMELGVIYFSCIHHSVLVSPLCLSQARAKQSQRGEGKAANKYWHHCALSATERSLDCAASRAGGSRYRFFSFPVYLRACLPPACEISTEERRGGHGLIEYLRGTASEAHEALAWVARNDQIPSARHVSRAYSLASSIEKESKQKME